jgi:subtilisin family serine protease
MKSMRILNLMVAILLVVGMLPLTTPALAAPRASDWNRDDPYVPGEVLVSFEEGLSASAYTAKASALAGSVGAMVSQQAGNLAVLQFDAAADVPALVEMLKESGMTALAQPNYIYAMPETAGAVLGRAMIQTEYRAGNQPNSPVLSMGEVSRLTHLVNSKATPVFPNELPGGGAWGWDYAQFDLIWPTVTSTSYKVCVVDTGIDAKHIDLLGRVTNLYDYVNDDILPNDDNGHGTAVAGVISAKTNSGTGTAMGASTASLFAVKSLNYEGVGTSYSVTAGVYKCVAQTTTKVINLSFSMDTPDDEMLYRAIYYAIVTKKMLVVAAAGNDSSSTPVYPAAWADANYNTMGDIPSAYGDNMFYDPLKKTTPKLTQDNNHEANVAKGLISVAAGRPVDDYNVWVDLDQSGDSTGPGELFNSEQCATGFTNYGAWISIAAPGESIYTTTPVSYPFYLNIEEGAAVGYDTFSGTSFAAPFVSAAAARYWGLNTTKTKDQVKAWLTDEKNGAALSLAVDDDAGVTPTTGYASDSGNGIPYGYYEFTPGDTSSAVYNAPFCWPTNTTPFGVDQEMSGIPYLNIAKALGRGGLWAAARFAADGSPAVGGLVSAYDTTSTTTATLRDSSKLVDPASPWVMLINLPVVTTPKVTVPETAMKPVQYKLGVSLTGFTTGVQYFNGITTIGGTAQPLFIAPGDFGSVVWGQNSYLKAVYDPNDNDPTNQDDYNTVSLAPYTHFRAVLDWKDEDIDGYEFTDTNFGEYPNLDMYLWLPENPNILSTGATNSREGVIGTNHFIGDPAKQLDTYDDFDTAGFVAALLKYGVGTLLDPLVLDPSGLFITFSPWAQYLFDGGFTPELADATPTAAVEYLAIKSGLTLSTTPFLKPKFVTGAYTLMVTDYSKEFSSGAPFINGNTASDNFVAPVLRLWSKGYLVADVRLEDAGVDCTGTNDWWKVLTLTGTAPYVTKVNTCDTGGTFMPYLGITP